MNLEEFTREVEESWRTCPPNLIGDQFIDQLGTNRALRISFMLGAGIGLLMCKAKGTDGMTPDDVRNYIMQESIEMLFEPVDQKGEQPDRHI